MNFFEDHRNPVLTARGMDKEPVGVSVGGRNFFGFGEHGTRVFAI